MFARIRKLNGIFGLPERVANIQRRNYRRRDSSFDTVEIQGSVVVVGYCVDVKGVESNGIFVSNTLTSGRREDFSDIVWGVAEICSGTDRTDPPREQEPDAEHNTYHRL